MSALSGSTPRTGSGDGAYTTGRARAVVACDAVFMALATVAVVARIASRRIKKESIGRDTLLLGFGLVFLYGNLVCEILHVSLGHLGHHMRNVSQVQLKAGVKVRIAAQCAYVMTMGIARVLICMSITRLPTIPKSYRRIIACILALNTLWIIYGILSVTLRCMPFSQNWLNTKPTSCVSSKVTLAVTFGCGLFISCILWVLAVFAGRYVLMPSLTRVGLAFVFTLGLVDIVVGIVTTVTMLTADVFDGTWTSAPPVIWQSLEPTVAIIVVSLVACRNVWDRLLRIPPLTNTSSITGSSNKSRSGRKSGVGNKNSYDRLKDADNGHELMPDSSTTAAGARHEHDPERTRSGFVKGSLPHNRARRDQMLSGGSTLSTQNHHRSMAGRDRSDLESGVFVRQDITVSAEKNRR